MRVEAIKKEDGLFIPMNAFLAKIPAKRMLVDIEFLEPLQAIDYDALDQLVGLCETGIADASVHHDTRIYTRNERP
jgi:hypothetical protein